MGNHRNQEPTSSFFHPQHEPHVLQEVMRTSQAVVGVFASVVRMPSSELAVLRQLAIGHPAPLGVLEVARRLGINPAAVTRLVTGLENRGLVSRGEDPMDARRKPVSLTAEGLRVFGVMHERGHALEQSIQAGLTDEEITTTMRVLTRFRAAIEALRCEGT